MSTVARKNDDGDTNLAKEFRVIGGHGSLDGRESGEPLEVGCDALSRSHCGRVGVAGEGGGCG